jgi:Fe2+ transport system protein FeoA
MKMDSFSTKKEQGLKKLTLANAPRSRMLKIEGIEDERDISRQLTPLGVFPGASIELVCFNPGGPVVVDVRGSQLMLDGSMAEKIIVKTC